MLRKNKKKEVKLSTQQPVKGTPGKKKNNPGSVERYDYNERIN